MVITFRIVIECRENHVVHVDPNWTSPVRWVMFSVALHVQRAVESNITFYSEFVSKC